MSENAAVRTEIDSNGIALLRFGDPSAKVTVLDLPMMDGLAEAVARLEPNPAAKGLVIVGCREDMFAAGADIEAIRGVTDPAEGERLARKGQLIFERIARLPFPVVAAIGGPCLGGGFEMALACRFRVASDHEKTRIGLPEVKLGILPGFGGTQRLPRVLGLPASLPPILTGRIYEPEPARRLGLVDEVVPAANLLRFARELAAGKVARKPRRVSRFWIEGNPLTRAFIARAARKGVWRETRGRYPAPLAAIESAAYGLASGIEQGLEREAKLLGKLIVSPESKSLVNLFFLSERSKKAAEPASGSPPISRAAVIGCGVMGAGIAIAMADKGIDVRLRDVSPEFVGKGIEQARKYFGQRAKRRRLTAVEARARLDRLTPALPPARLSGSQLVIEAVAEKIEIKVAVFQAVAREVDSETILATNTSSLSVSALQKELSHPERVVGIHFFNPVDKMPLVEVVRGEKTSPLVVGRAAGLAVRLGKFPVVVKDVPGFLVNRILAPYLNEAAHLLAEGASMRAIDETAEHFGMPMGPVALLDEVGLDIAASAGKTMLAAYGERMKAPPLLDKLLEAGRKGKKTGSGFYAHRDAKRRPDPSVPSLLGLPHAKRFSSEEIVDRLVLPIVNESLRCLDEEVVASAEDVDLASVMGFGFAPFRGGVLRYGETIGFPSILQKLQRLQDTLGNRFSPAPLLLSLANQGRSLRH